MNLINKVFTRLTIIGEGYYKKSRHYVECECVCGVRKFIQLRSLVTSNTKSCGCLNKEKGNRGGARNIKHGYSRHPILNFYKNMRRRCNDLTEPNYKYYRGRGITIDPSWLGPTGFINFLNDMLPSYEKGLTLDRRDNDGPYSKDNCRWVTRKVQAQNRSNSVWISANNIKMVLTDFCTKYSLSRDKVQRLLNKGLDGDEILHMLSVSLILV